MVYAGSEAATSHNLTTVDGYGCTVHVGEEVQDGEEHSLAASGSVCISFHMGASSQWVQRHGGRADWQIGRAESRQQRADRIGWSIGGEPLRRSQIAVQAGKQAASQHEPAPAPAPEPEPEARPADEPCSSCCALV